MDLLLVADGHYFRDKHGDVYVETTYDYQFYSRYLAVFDKVYAVVRIENIDKASPKLKKCSGTNLEFLELPAFTGPWEYIKHFPHLKKLAKQYSQKASCGIFRLPAATANFMCKSFSKTKKPFAVEIVVDPWENFAPGSIRSILRPVIRYTWTKLVKDMCKKANGASYVTQNYLQEKYPCAADLKKNSASFKSWYSSVELPDDEFAQPRKYELKKTWTIIHVANTFADYGKGHIPLMNALKIVRRKGYDVQIEFVGDGSKKDEFIQYAKSQNISDAVKFLGRLPSGDRVRQQMKKADLFVFPTKAEGLPRALLEAMSVGLPCLSSPTCGIPEVLDKKYLYQYEDYNGFASGIIDFIENPLKMEQASSENIVIAKHFSSSVLNKRRKEFYEQLKRCVK